MANNFSKASMLDFTLVKSLGPRCNLVVNSSNHLKVIYKLELIPIDQNKILQELFLLNSKMKHEYLVNIETSFFVQNTLYIIMEYCEGGNLRDLISRAIQYDDILNESEIMDWFVQLLLVLNYVHQSNEYIEEIFPRKILLRNNNIKISFLSIFSRCLQNRNLLFKPQNEEALEDNKDGHILNVDDDYKLNDLFYSSPKKLSSNDPLTSNEKELTWSLGVILYELFTLKKIFNESDLKNISSMIPLLNFEDLSLSLPTYIKEIWISLMKVNPEERVDISSLLKEDKILELIMDMQSYQIASVDQEDQDIFILKSNKLNEYLINETNESSYDEENESEFFTAEDIANLLNTP